MAVSPIQDGIFVKPQESARTELPQDGLFQCFYVGNLEMLPIEFPVESRDRKTVDLQKPENQPMWIPREK